MMAWFSLITTDAVLNFSDAIVPYVVVAGIPIFNLSSLTTRPVGDVLKMSGYSGDFST